MNARLRGHDDNPLSEPELEAQGLLLRAPHGIDGELRYERPAYPFGHRLKHCTLGAFAFFNPNGVTSAYRVRFGRYTQIGESSIIGPPEHPHDWFSSHPFAFTRPRHMPNIYRLPDFARLAPDEDAGPAWAELAPQETVIGHEAYLGAGSFVKRGVRIGDGAVVGARSVVTRDIPDYAIAVGAPARVLRLRFADAIVERFLRLQWWRYDLAPFKRDVDFARVEATLDFFEQALADKRLQALQPASFRLAPTDSGLMLTPLSSPLYFS
ncbi:MAG: CatB-related O-acetyltransferase [Sinimarinibacterium sp.]|jgi:acetyltransferase-like isoleucine patch superfamily enzyme